MNKPSRGMSPQVKSSRHRSTLEWGAGNHPDDSSAEREEAFRRAIIAIPPGKVNTYGGVAAAAGYPRYHRAVARLLRQDYRDQLPWHRVVGADGALKTSGPSAKEQRARLRMEGVKFRGDRIEGSAFLSAKEIGPVL